MRVRASARARLAARVLSNTSLLSGACPSVALFSEKSSLRNELTEGVHGKKTLAKREALRALARLVRRVGGSESRIAWVFAAHALPSQLSCLRSIFDSAQASKSSFKFQAASESSLRVFEWSRTAHTPDACSSEQPERTQIRPGHLCAPGTV